MSFTCFLLVIKNNLQRLSSLWLCTGSYVWATSSVAKSDVSIKVSLLHSSVFDIKTVLKIPTFCLGASFLSFQHTMTNLSGDSTFKGCIKGQTAPLPAVLCVRLGEMGSVSTDPLTDVSKSSMNNSTCVPGTRSLG